MISAKTEEEDRIIGLDFGADDYITKPFSPREVMARVRALLRRYDRTEPEEIVCGEMVIFPGKHITTISDTKISMTKKEEALLILLAGHRS